MFQEFFKVNSVQNFTILLERGKATVKEIFVIIKNYQIKN